MGYDVHISRKNDWYEEDQSKNITLEEWKAYIASDEEMRFDGFAEFEFNNGQFLRSEDDSLAVWTKYSKNQINGNQAWIRLSNGCIVVKNPDEEFLTKMIQIARYFKARVQGDEGEFYD